MPGPKTHDIFFKRLKTMLPPDMLAGLPRYDAYNIYAQGHDLAIYCDYWKFWALDRNLRVSLAMQEGNLREWVYRYLCHAQEAGLLRDERARMFLFGYVQHHLLDSRMHPLIIHYSGDHVRDARNRTWRHGIIETLLDSWFMWKYEGTDSRVYPVHRDFAVPDDAFAADLLPLLNSSFQEAYGTAGAGANLKNGALQTARFLRTLKYDPTGRKKVLFDRLDPIAKGSASFSYHVDPGEAEEYLNLAHQVWHNPKDERAVSRQSMPELFEAALAECAGILCSLDRLCLDGGAQRQQIDALIPDRTASYGIPCRS